MRRFLAPSLALLAAACATAPVTKPEPVVTRPTPVASGELIGLTVQELGQRFGQPRFQVQEGAGTKLQWAGGGCILDVYLYPPADGRGVQRVTYADARRPSGAEIDVAGCLGLITP
jgi:hypothetical protein